MIRTAFRALFASILSLIFHSAAVSQVPGAPVRLSTLNGSSLGARVVSDGLNVHVVWVEGYSSTNAQVNYVRSTDGGGTWGSPIAIASNISTTTPLAMLAAKGSNVVIVWTSAYATNGSASSGLYAAYSTNTGTTFSGGSAPIATLTDVSNAIANTPNFGNTAIPDLRPSSVTIDSQNRVHIGFYGGPNIGRALHKMSCDGGNTWLPIALISVGDRGIDAEAPRLFEQGGTLYAAYRSTLDGVPIEGWPPFSLRVARMVASTGCSGSTSGTWLSPSQLLPGTGYSNMANVYGAEASVGASGNAYLAYWNEASGGANLNLRTRGAGGAWSAETDVTSAITGFGNNSLEHDSDAAEYGAGRVTEGTSGKLNLVVASNDAAPNGQYPNRLGMVYYRLSTSSGATWSAPIALNSAADAFGVDSSTSGDTVHVVWSTTAYNAPGGTEIVYRAIDTSKSPTPVGFVATNPARLLDTRQGYTTIDNQFAGIGAVNAGGQIDLAVASRNVIPADATAVVMNVTVTNPTAAGYVTAWPTGTTRPNASNLNFVANQTIPNLVIAKLGTGGKVSLYNPIGKTDLIVDVTGYFGTGADFVALSPARLLDTRAGYTTIDGTYQGIGALSAGGRLDLPISGRAGIPVSGIGAAILNTTAVTPSAPGYLTLWPSDAAQPFASNLNFVPGDIIPNLVLSKVSSTGKVSIYNSAGNTDVLADVAGYFPTTSQLTPVIPARLMDTRPGAFTIDSQFAGAGALASGSITNLAILGRGGVPTTGVDSVVLNVTVTSPSAVGYLTVWPSGAAQPNASNLNFVANQTIPNLVIAKVGAGGSVAIYTGTAGTTQIIADVVGWFSGP